MTTEQLQAEMAYHASLKPFTCLLNDGVISEEDYDLNPDSASYDPEDER